MGGGDLNNKKSWGVHTQAAQTKVWQAEQAALKERKRAEILKKERDEERAVEELRRIAAESGTSSTLIDPKIAWMYQDAKAGPGGVAEETEAYLLGKRRVDNIIIKQDQLKQEIKQDADPLGAVLSSRDITVKAALDPMFAIEQTRQKSLQNMLADPAIRRRMLKEISKEKSVKDRDAERHGRKHRHHDEDRHRSSKRRRYSDDERDDRREHRRHRARSYSKSRSRSRSPYRPRDERRYAARPLTPDDSTHERRRKESNRSRSRSPRRKGREDRHSRRERSPYSYDRRPRHDRYENDSSFSRREHNRDAKPLPSPPDSQNRESIEAERAAKLAAMSASANDLEEARKKRLAEMEARDAEAKRREDERRGKHADRFVDNLRSKAGDQGLADRLQRVGSSVRLQDTI